MFEFLKNYDGVIEINGNRVENNDICRYEKDCDSLKIHLIPKGIVGKVNYRVIVKGWMCNNSSNLDFHKRWNNSNPMPCNEMYGTIIAETPGMWKMDLADKNGGNHWIGFVSKAAVIEMKEI